MAGASILATICAERLTKFVTHYSKAQSVIARTNPVQAQGLLALLNSKYSLLKTTPKDRKPCSLWQQPEHQQECANMLKARRLEHINDKMPTHVHPKENTQLNRWLGCSAINARSFAQYKTQLPQIKSVVLPKNNNGTSRTIGNMSNYTQKLSPIGLNQQMLLISSARSLTPKKTQAPYPLLAHYAFAGAATFPGQRNRNTLSEKLELQKF